MSRTSSWSVMGSAGGDPADPGAAPDVAILDPRLPDGSGIDVCREVRSLNPEIKALILTSYDDDEALFSAIMAGAAGYVLKQVRGNDLVDMVRRVAAGESTWTLGHGAGPRAGAQRAAGRQGAGGSDRAGAQDLGPIGEGLTNRQIAQQMSLAEKTVKNYVSSMLAKLGLMSPRRLPSSQSSTPRTRRSRLASKLEPRRRPVTSRASIANSTRRVPGAQTS